MSTLEKIRRLAATWRERNPQCSEGIVLIFRGRAYGWKNALRDPNHEKPGVYAVDAAGAVFRAIGGDAYNGAAGWKPVCKGGTA